MLPRTLLICAVALMLSACAGGTPPIKAIPWTAPANVMRACPDLPLTQDGSLAALFRNHKDVAQLYQECKALNQDKMAVIRNHETR